MTYFASALTLTGVRFLHHLSCAISAGMCGAIAAASTVIITLPLVWALTQWLNKEMMMWLADLGMAAGTLFTCLIVLGAAAGFLLWDWAQGIAFELHEEFAFRQTLERLSHRRGPACGKLFALLLFAAAYIGIVAVEAANISLWISGQTWGFIAPFWPHHLLGSPEVDYPTVILLCWGLTGIIAAALWRVLDPKVFGSNPQNALFITIPLSGIPLVGATFGLMLSHGGFTAAFVGLTAGAAAMAAIIGFVFSCEEHLFDRLARFLRT